MNDEDPSTLIALRYDKTHVWFRLGENGDFLVEPGSETMFHKLPPATAEYGGAETSEPDAKVWDSIREHFDQAHVGEQWQLELSPGSRIDVTVQKPIELVWGCADDSYAAGFIAEIPSRFQSTFSALRQDYFLIHKPPQDSTPLPAASLAHAATLRDWTPTPEARLQVEQAIVEGLRKEIAHEQDRRAYGDLPKRLEESADAGKAKLSYEIHALQLSPDDVPRLFVHARWMVDQRIALIMNVWLRAGRVVTLEPLDEVTTRAFWLSSRSGEPLPADEIGFDDLGFVLNVFDRPDGYGDVLIYFHGYEGYGIDLYRYTDAGLVATKISQGDGC